MIARLSLLQPGDLIPWRGLPLMYLRTPVGEWSHRFTPPVTSLALIDTGRIESEIRVTGRSLDAAWNEGSLTLFKGDQEIRANQRGSHDARRVIVDLACSSLLDDESTVPLQPSIGFYDPALASLVRAMLREVRSGCENGSLYAESLSLGLVLHLQRTRSAPAELRRGERGCLSRLQHARLDELIAEGLTADLSLTALCSAMALSKTHFVRLFRNTTGTSPHRYVMSRRIERAHQLILDGDLPLAEVASATGFASQSHLNRIYRSTYGVTPGVARQRKSH